MRLSKQDKRIGGRTDTETPDRCLTLSAMATHRSYCNNVLTSTTDLRIQVVQERPQDFG